jgi:anthranilate phosphoribosyltransferase
VVELNAAAALMAAGQAESLEAGMRLAAESIDTGAARRKLEELVDFTRRAGR